MSDEPDDERFHPGNLGLPEHDPPRREIDRLSAFILTECTSFGVPRVDELHPNGMSAVDAAIAVIRQLKAECVGGRTARRLEN